jgi:hypothetical protein
MVKKEEMVKRRKYSSKKEDGKKEEMVKRRK